MLHSTKEKHVTALIRVRNVLGYDCFYSEDFVLGKCSIAYGRAPARATWERWKDKVLAHQDPPGPGLSRASYLLLLTLAGLLRGNSQGSPVSQVSLSRLAEAALSVLRLPEREPSIPEHVSYSQLRYMAETQAMRTYSDRYHRMNGLKKGQAFYSKTEATQILSKYPDSYNVQKSA